MVTCLLYRFMFLFRSGILLVDLFRFIICHTRHDKTMIEKEDDELKRKAKPFILRF